MDYGLAYKLQREECLLCCASIRTTSRQCIPTPQPSDHAVTLRTSAPSDQWPVTVMEISPQLSSLHVFLVVLPHISQMWTKSGFNSSVKPGRAFRCCLQRGVPWPCTLVVLTTRRRSGCISCKHISLDKGARLPGSSVDKTNSNSRCLCAACHLCMQVQMSYVSMHLFQERSEVHSCLWLWRNSML